MVLLWNWLDALDKEVKLVIAGGDRVVERGIVSEELSDSAIGESEENAVNTDAVAEDVVDFVGAVVDSLVGVALLEVDGRHCYQSLLCLASFTVFIIHAYPDKYKSCVASSQILHNCPGFRQLYRNV